MEFSACYLAFILHSFPALAAGLRSGPGVASQSRVVKAPWHANQVNLYALDAG